jgi:1,2-diacylglycerol 3-alpha-glucosyltransferase
MRVAVFAESYLPYVSGVTVSTDALARGLGLLGHEVLVVAPRPRRGDEPGEVGSPGPAPRHAWLPSYQLPAVAPAGYRMPWPLPFSGRRAVAGFNPDVVHTQSPFVVGLMARSVARRTGAPLVYTHHTRFADYGHYAGPLALPVSRGAEAYLRRFWLGCQAVVAPSSDLAAEIAERLAGRARPLVRAIPTGIDVAGIAALPAADLRTEPGWPGESVVAATLGRLAPEKSVDLVLGAFALAAADDGRLRLLVVGGGPSEPVLKARASAPDLAGRVHFTGALPRRDALAQLRGADLFAFASQSETQGLVLAEALACGLPVVSFAGPGVSDAVRDGVDGIVVPRGLSESARVLGQAMGRIAADTKLREQMAAAALTGASRFDVARRVGQVSELYAELLGTPAAAPDRRDSPMRRR